MGTNRYMKVQASLLAALVASALALAIVGLAPAFAQHPTEVGGMECTIDREGAETLVQPSMEKWKCVYVPEFDGYFWVPAPSDINPEVDATAYMTRNFFDAETGRTYRVTSRAEWIDYVLHVGTDLDVRKPATSPLVVKAERVGVMSRWYRWDGTAWTICGETNWYNNRTATSHLSRTKNAGTAPCDWGWYAATSWVEYYDAARNKWKLLDGQNPIAGTWHTDAVNLGKAEHGQVWDPKPGDEEHEKPTIEPGPLEKLKEKVKNKKVPTPAAPE